MADLRSVRRLRRRVRRWLRDGRWANELRIAGYIAAGALLAVATVLAWYSMTK